MIFYVLIAAFVAGLGAGGFGMSSWDDAKVARHEKAEMAAQKKIDEQGAQAVKQANDEIAKMQLAYEAGRAKAKIVTRENQTKAENYVQNTPSLRSPQCSIGPDGVSILASQTSAVQVAAAQSVLGLSVSSTVYSQGNNNVGGGTVPAVSGQSNPTGRLPIQVQQLRPADEGVGAAALGLHRPKPKPIE